ncbi:hypothetical protein BR93DRAFT_942027 [Coniochaeta sp. PMI_546]|nr:hypothetical protein BR93DRAFT_942027 [Coniochaeta sp. PMI_546]
MSIGAAINDLFSSIYELFASVLGGIYNTIHAILAAIIGLFSGFINLIGDVFKGAVDVVGGLGKFLAKMLTEFVLIGNIVIVGIIAAGGYAYVRYQQGRPIAPAAQKKVQ